MNILRIARNTVAVVTFLCFTCSCDNQDKVKESEIDKIISHFPNVDQDENTYYFQRYFLPYKRELYFVTPDQNTKENQTNKPVDFPPLFWSNFEKIAKEGIIGGEVRHHHFLFCVEGEARGLSFLPAGVSLMKDESRLQISSGLGELGNITLKENSTIHSIKSINDLSSLEFIEFGFEIITPEVWEDILFLSDNNNLSGLSILCSESFFENWPGFSMNNIRGMICHVASIDELEKIGKAFPNLEFLCVVIAGNSEFKKYFPYLLTSDFFTNLKSLMFGYRYWHINQINIIENNTESMRPLRVEIKDVNKNLIWIGIDGGILSINDMISYNQFARALDYQRKTNEGNIVDVRFIRFGFANDVCKSFSSSDYHGLEDHWKEAK